jgi:hypothetical protein
MSGKARENAIGPTVRLAFGNRPQEQQAVDTDRLPALLVSFPYLKAFVRNRHKYRFRNWVLDSGAFSMANGGKSIALADYLRICRELLDSDTPPVEIFALDVIGDHKTSASNAAAMWKAGIKAIPTFHHGEPEDALLRIAGEYPKIAIGGVAYKRGLSKLRWAEQVFARVWPKKVHGFAFAAEEQVLGLPFHSVDASSWEIGPCGWGNWKQFGDLQVRGSEQNLRGEVAWFLDLEERARVKWAKQMAQLRTRNAPQVRLAVVSTLGRGELNVT